MPACMPASVPMQRLGYGSVLTRPLGAAGVGPKKCCGGVVTSSWSCIACRWRWRPQKLWSHMHRRCSSASPAVHRARRRSERRTQCRGAPRIGAHVSNAWQPCLGKDGSLEAAAAKFRAGLSVTCGAASAAAACGLERMGGSVCEAAGVTRTQSGRQAAPQ